MNEGGTYVQDRARATRRSLLEAAAHLFVERGYVGTSINDISGRSGKTSGAVYFHYSSKEKLALAVVREQFAAWPQLTPYYTDPDVPPLEKLVALSFEVARVLREDVVARAGARLWAERRSIDAAVPAPFAAWTGAVTRLLAEARSKGELAEGIEPSGTATTLVCALYGLYNLTDEVAREQELGSRLDQWWLLILNVLQARPDPAVLIARARARFSVNGPPASAG
ncbi:TetR/AcrR family transcriptional regulator [Streptomyces sp. NBC_00846]|uniref:ScbR family autoregulator-binding transcription factor n=1 Tax=Streptomyces sp. NBC_00846 TaxID=2975849 RepID=UPI0038633344|nr:TetR/AcrR family transcriptional regulator [Streptomyces sp. NBC_00846]